MLVTHIDAYYKYKFQKKWLFFKSLTDGFVGVSDYQPECLGLPTFHVKRDSFADFKKKAYFEEMSR